jgi:hypothetical protein
MQWKLLCESKRSLENLQCVVEFAGAARISLSMGAMNNEARNRQETTVDHVSIRRPLSNSQQSVKRVLLRIFPALSLNKNNVLQAENIFIAKLQKQLQFNFQIIILPSNQ